MVLRTAKVIDDKDPDKLSRVKVKVLPEMKDVEDDLLPWAEPAISGYGTGASHGNHAPPEKDSFVAIRIDDGWKKFVYAHDEYVEGFAIYSQWEDISGDLTDYGQGSYPQPRMIVGKDGTIRFHNTETGAVGVYHHTGSFVYFSPEGKLSIKAAQGVQIDGGSEKFVTFSQLSSVLGSLMQTITTHKHIDPLSGALPPSPDLVTLATTLNTEFTEQLATMKSITSD